LEVGRDGLPWALLWAKLFRPVGACHLLLDPALKGRHIVALGNAQGTRSNRIIQALKGRNNPTESKGLTFAEWRDKSSLVENWMLL